jgi:ATP-binding cassette subfamily C protein
MTNVDTRTTKDAIAENASMGSADRKEPPARLLHLIAAQPSGRRTLVIVTALSAALNILMLAGSIYMLAVYDLVLPSRSIPTLVGLFAMVLAAYAFQGALDQVRSRVLIHYSTLVDHSMNPAARRLIVQRARAAPHEDAFQPLRDSDQIRQFLSGNGPAAIADLPWVPVFLLALFLLHPLLGATVLVGGGLLVALTWAADRITRDETAQLARATSARARLADANRRSAATIAVMGMDRHMAGHWSRASVDLLAANERLAGIAGLIGSFSRVFRLVLQSIVLTVGAILVVKGYASGGVIFASSILSSRALGPIDGAIANWRSLVAARLAWSQFAAALADLPQTQRAVALPRPRERLDVEGLTASPPGAEPDIIRGVSLTALAGEAIAIVGPNGSGKSTLLRTIAGLYPMRAGAVRLDKADMADFTPESLGASLGYVPQDVELIDGSIAQNIARFDPTAGHDAIVAAARAAGVHDAIGAMPEGYAREVGVGGSALSGGERQRVALARALFGDPFLILLDEPDAHLDDEARATLGAAIAAARSRGAIILMVAHGPRLLPHVSHILAMRNGTALAFGPRERMSRHADGLVASPDP